MKKRIIGAIAGVALMMTAVVPLASAQAEDDLILFRADWGAWYGNVSSNGFGDFSETTSLVGFGAQWGPPWVYPLVGDVNGDGMDDMVVVQDPEQDGGTWAWFAAHSSDTNNDGVVEMSSVEGSNFGLGGVDNTTLTDLADINGDGIQDAIHVTTNFVWVTTLSTTNGLGTGSPQGNILHGTTTLNDKPILGDFNGDGMDDFGVWRQDTGETFVRLTGGTVGSGVMGTGNGGTNVVGVFQNAIWDYPLIGDINGDGRDDMVLIEDDTTGNLMWHAAFGQADGSLNTNEQSNVAYFGVTNDIPMLADINGDGMADMVAVRINPGGALSYFAAFTESGGVLEAAGEGSTIGWGHTSLNDIPLFGQLNTEILPPPEIGPIAVDQVPSGLELTWTTGPGHDYLLQTKGSLTDVSWADNSTNTSTGASMTVTTAVDQAQSFYRVIVE